MKPYFDWLRGTICQLYTFIKGVFWSHITNDICSFIQLYSKRVWNSLAFSLVNASETHYRL